MKMYNKSITQLGRSEITECLLCWIHCLHNVCIPIWPLGDYEKLWDAVTGGRGTGRGKKRTKPKDKEAVPTGFGEEFKEQISSHGNINLSF